MANPIAMTEEQLQKLFCSVQTTMLEQPRVASGTPTPHRLTTCSSCFNSGEESDVGAFNDAIGVFKRLPDRQKIPVLTVALRAFTASIRTTFRAQNALPLYAYLRVTTRPRYKFAIISLNFLKMATTTTLSTPEEDVLMASDWKPTVYGNQYPNTSHFPHHQSFKPFDYCIFSAMLGFSALIGVHFAFCAKQKQNTTSEYLMGGKNMGVIPVSLSLIASYVSAIGLLGKSGEMYTYGTQYSMVLIGLIISSFVCGICFMPVFYKLQLNSSYEYLEIRFDRRVRLLGSVLYITGEFLHISMVIYVPALALNQVTGVNIHLISPLVCLVCIFYTTLGGLKAVVWTDVLQTVMMFGAMIVVVCIGTIAVGGVSNVWERNERSGRLELFNLDPDPTTRHTFWNTALASTFFWISDCATNQSMVQRFLTMPTIRRAQIMIVIFTVGVFFISAASFYAGLLIFASYHDCDLIASQIVRAPDQILPYFVMDVSSPVPGLPGLFIAGIFSAALSTMSTGLNSMSGVIYEDFIRPNLKVRMSEEKASFTMKIICALIGVLGACMVFIVEHLGAILQVADSLGGITNGPTLAVFVLGMFFPWANAKGTLAGGLTGMVIMGILCFGSQAAFASGQITFQKKPFSIEGCTFLSQNESSAVTDLPSFTEPTSISVVDGPFPIFRLSYTLYTLLGLVISVGVGLAVSFATGPTDPKDVHIDLLTPVIHRFFAKRCKSGDEGAKWKTPESVQVIKEQDEIHNLLAKNKSKGNGDLEMETLKD